MTRIFAALTFAAAVLMAPSTLLAHSGGTDSAGCHAGTKPYHCHNGK